MTDREMMLETCEAEYSRMAELLTGPVRSYEKNAWCWAIGNLVAFYAKDEENGLRLLLALESTEYDGVEGRQYMFNQEGILRVLPVAFSDREINSPDLPRLVVQLHSLELRLTGGLEVTDALQDELDSHLIAPLMESQS